MSTDNKNDNAGRSRTPHQRPRMGGPGRGIVPGEKAKDFKGSMKMIFKLLGKYKINVAVVAVSSMVGTVFMIVGPKILSRAITTLFDGLVSKYTEGGSIDFGSIGHTLIILVCLYVVAMFFNLIQGWIMAGVTQKIGFETRAQISEKIHRMPMKYFEGNSVGDILSRITNDVDTMIQGMNMSFTQLISNVTTIIGVLIMMLSISLPMTGIALLMLPLSGGLLVMIIKLSQKYFNRQQDTLGEVNGLVEETISGLSVVKLFNHEEQARKEFDETNDELFNAAWKSQFFSGVNMPALNLIGNLGYVGIVFAGALFAFKGSITVGDIQAFIQYVRNLTQPMAMIAQVSNQMQGMAAAAERVFEFLSEEEEVQDADNAVVLKEAEGHVDFRHVSFGYDPEKVIINDFNEDVDPGMTVAIVGPTGAGKTTMVKLLMRFYDVDKGGISLDDFDIRNITRESLRKNFGMVLQDTWLFKGTIRENIRYGRQDATDEEVIAAAKAAHVHHFIKTLPGGYDMELSEDAENISQGQRQLFTIARAILAGSPILILDEATSSVDTRTEEMIQSAMNNLKKDRTSFIIAHRLSTIRDADLILVMKNGDVIEQGRHEELLEANGFYAELYNSQFDTMKEIEEEIIGA